MSDKEKKTDAAGRIQRTEDQRQAGKKDLERDALYRNVKQAEDMFYERLSENYSAG